MKHNHHDHCEHEEVAYCGHCQVVYCRGCKRGWSGCKRSHWPYTSVWGSVPCGTDSSAPIDISSDTISESTGAAGITVNEVKFVPTACSHA